MKKTRDETFIERLPNGKRVNTSASSRASSEARKPLWPRSLPSWAMPLLHACRLRAGSIADDWTRGHCPLCGAWPTLAEARGLERARRLRCARCGTDWRADWLRCPYCATADHERLGGLMSEASGETRKVETSDACRGYIKALTRLVPTPPTAIALDDLATLISTSPLSGTASRGQQDPDTP